MQDIKKASILISIASFCDDMLLFTIDSALKKARYPNRVYFAVVDQSFESKKDSLVSIKKNINYVHIVPSQSLGVCWARSIAMSAYDGQEYFLQIDSHTVFEPYWDIVLVNDYLRIRERCANDRFVITTRPLPFVFDLNGFVSRQREIRTTILLEPKVKIVSKSEPVIHFSAVPALDRKYYRGFQVAAAFMFSIGSLVEEVFYDPFYYFHGEEQSYSLRLFTHGWDIWHTPNVPLFHLYKNRDAGEPPLHWDEPFIKGRSKDPSGYKKRSDDRLWMLYNNEINGQFGLGKERSMENFSELSGIGVIRS